MPWAAPVVIPIIVILAVYTLGLTACISYRRHRKNKREKESNGDELDKEKADEEPAFFREGDRHPSVDTVLTIESFDDSIKADKHNIWFLTQSASGSLLLSSSDSRKNSDATLVSPISSSEQTLQSPTSVHSERTLVGLPDPRDRRAVVAGRQGRSLRIIIPSSDEQD